MKKSMSFTFAFLITLILICPRLRAAEAGQFYVGLDFGSSRVKSDGPKDDSIFAPNQQFKSSDFVYELHAGFQFNEWFAAEFGLMDFGSTSHRFEIKDGIFFLVQ